MKTVLAALLAFGLATQGAFAQDLSTKSMDALIDDLTTVHDSAVGIADADMYVGFLASDEEPRFAGGLLPIQGVTTHPSMREIVRRGAAALPALLAHLGDRRETGLRVGREMSLPQGFGGQYFNDEYDARDLNAEPSDCFSRDDQCRRTFSHPYTIKVGDVCEVLIGQIVNRRLSAARYQPSALLFVNSPIETPSLAERLRKDWSGLDATAHEASLLKDLRFSKELEGWPGYRDALVRLRFYYPKTYAALSGEDLKKRYAFEADEKTRK